MFHPMVWRDLWHVPLFESGTRLERTQIGRNQQQGHAGLHSAWIHGDGFSPPHHKVRVHGESEAPTALGRGQRPRVVGCLGNEMPGITGSSLISSGGLLLDMIYHETDHFCGWNQDLPHLTRVTPAAAGASFTTSLWETSGCPPRSAPRLVALGSPAGIEAGPMRCGESPHIFFFNKVPACQKPMVRKTWRIVRMVVAW